MVAVYVPPNITAMRLNGTASIRHLRSDPALRMPMSLCSVFTIHSGQFQMNEVTAGQTLEQGDRYRHSQIG